MPKKKFIDKKNATTFVLAHRSQRDPLITDETAPQNILLPLDQVPNFGGTAGGPSTHSRDKREEIAKRKEEQKKYGIYFDDDYDYLQHIRDSQEVSTVQWDYCERIYAPEISNKDSAAAAPVKREDLISTKLNLPSSVFESEYQEDVGLLNKAAVSKGPRPDLDPDVLAALDDDFERDDDPNNALEDNFMELANQGEGSIIDGEPAPEDLEGLFSDEDEGEKNDDSDEYEDEKEDSLGSLNGPQYSFDDEETKSRFTNYSMSSSVVRRNKQLLLVDDRFEKMFEGYDDTEIGALDCDEIEGTINPDDQLLFKYAEEFEEDRKKEELLHEKITNLALKNEDSDSSDENMTDSDDEGGKKERWDCESILSTYSNTKNRPRIISAPSRKNVIRVSGRTGIPVGELGKGLTKQNLKVLDSAYEEEHNVKPSARERSIISGVTSIRSKNETTEERRERKKIVKEYRKERRVERKGNIEAFKEEKKKLVKVRLNDKHNVQGLKL